MNRDLLWVIFILIAALGLTSLAEWFFINVLTPIGDITQVLVWMSKLNEMTPFELIVSFLLMMAPVVLGAILWEKIQDKFRL
jgi:hypothetical protein